jgi:hypothetical protein
VTNEELRGSRKGAKGQRAQKEFSRKDAKNAKKKRTFFTLRALRLCVSFFFLAVFA